MPLPRALTPLLLVAIVGLASTACAPEPAPSPSPKATGWATDEEAFAAAKATYLAYVDALNHVDLSDPATFEPVYEWLTGDALSEETESLSSMNAEGWTVVGTSSVFDLSLVERDSETMVLGLCLDVSEIDLLDATGESVVSADRRDIQPVHVTLVNADSGPLALLISDSEATADLPCER